MIELRTNKSLFIDEEAQKAFQFCGEIRQNLEKAIGYRLVSKVQLLFLHLQQDDFVMLDVAGNEDTQFIYFCREELIEDFKEQFFFSKIRALRLTYRYLYSGCI